MCPSANACAVSSTQKFLVQQHITTSKHQANKQLNSKQRQLFLTQPTTSNVRSEFNIDLCRSLISADIPLYKLKNKVFREFLEKYTQHTIPDESTLRKTYAPSIYDETIQKIRDEIKDSSIWVSIDETPDKEETVVSVSHKPKRRPYLLKRKALTTGFFDTSRGKDDKDKDNGGGLVFGIPIGLCLENDRLSRMQRGGSPGRDEPSELRRKSHHGSRSSFSSLIETTTARGDEKSVKQCAFETGVSRSSVQRILKTAKWKVYIPRLLHTMNEDDPDRQIEY
ncbi:hypothetical protein ANN_08734, partial [Periplaneta americana]